MSTNQPRDQISSPPTEVERLGDLYRQAALDDKSEQAALEWIEANVDDCLPDEDDGCDAGAGLASPGAGGSHR